MKTHRVTQLDKSGVQPARRASVGQWCVELLPRRAYEAIYTPDVPIIGFSFESQVGVHAFASDRRNGFRAKPNALAYVPIGCDVYSQSDHGGEYLKITAIQNQGQQQLGERRFSDVIDPAAIDVAQKLRGMLLKGAPIDKLRFESLILKLMQRAAWILNSDRRPPRAGSWMTAQRLKRIDELIEAGLEEKLTVQQLASALGLSAGFFSRAFKSAVGKAPHDYIIDRRISRARTLLQNNGLATVALASGFTSHAHMSTAFQSRLGVSPSLLRKMTM